MFVVVLERARGSGLFYWRNFGSAWSAMVAAYWKVKFSGEGWEAGLVFRQDAAGAAVLPRLYGVTA